MMMQRKRTHFNLPSCPKCNTDNVDAQSEYEIARGNMVGLQTECRCCHAVLEIHAEIDVRLILREKQ